jgi:hypothetical protein
MERRSEWEGDHVCGSSSEENRGCEAAGRTAVGWVETRRQDLDVWIKVVAASVRPCPAVPSSDKFSRGKWADLSSCGPDT